MKYGVYDVTGVSFVFSTNTMIRYRSFTVSMSAFAAWNLSALPCQIVLYKRGKKEL